MKYFNINTNVNNDNTNAGNNNGVNNDNNNNNNSNNNDNNNNNDVNNNTNDEDDDKTRDKISDIRAIVNRLGNIVTNDRKKINKELYEIRNKKNLSDKQKGKNDYYLVELVNTLNKKENYKYHDRDDLDYHGIRDVENLFDDVNNDDYYKPLLVKSSFKENYKYNESRCDNDKKLSVTQYLNMIKPYLSDLINDQKAIENNSNGWKIQINMYVNFVSSSDNGENRTIFVWSYNEGIRLGDINETDDINKRLINSFLNNSQKEKIISRNGSNFVSESVDLLPYRIHKKSLKRGNSYVKSSVWLINKRATINPKNKDDKCFQYSITVALNHQNIENHPERISNIEPFIDQYNWEGIEFPTRTKGRKKFEKNNKTIVLNILFAPHNEKIINLAYKSKYNRERKNQVVLLTITNSKKWH